MKITAWARQHLLTWTVGVTVLVFLFGPFIQDHIGDFLNRWLAGEPIQVNVCTPLESATLLVSSGDGENVKIHSANTFPFMQKMQVIITNRSGVPALGSAIFVAPLNSARNEVVDAAFYTDNNISSNEISVDEGRDGSYRINLGSFNVGQVLVMDFLALHPTSFLVEFGSEQFSSKTFTDAGSCDTDEAPESVIMPVDIYQRVEEPSASADLPDFTINDVIEPIGPLSWDVQIRYDCGSGLETQTIPMGGPVEYCGIHINDS